MIFSLRLAAVTAAVWVATAAVTCDAATSKSFVVEATIVNGCAVSQVAGSWGKIDFGTAPGLSTGPIEASLVSGGTNGISIECTPGTTATLSADGGNNALSGQRQLAQAGVTPAVPYALFVNGAATPWTTQAIALSFLAGSTRQTVPIRGRATLPGTLRAGKYTDTVRVTLAW